MGISFLFFCDQSYLFREIVLPLWILTDYFLIIFLCSFSVFPLMLLKLFIFFVLFLYWTDTFPYFLLYFHNFLFYWMKCIISFLFFSCPLIFNFKSSSECSSKLISSWVNLSSVYSSQNWHSTNVEYIPMLLKILISLSIWHSTSLLFLFWGQFVLHAFKFLHSPILCPNVPRYS